TGHPASSGWGSQALSSCADGDGVELAPLSTEPFFATQAGSCRFRWSRRTSMTVRNSRAEISLSSRAAETTPREADEGALAQLLDSAVLLRLPGEAHREDLRDPGDEGADGAGDLEADPHVEDPDRREDPGAATRQHKARGLAEGPQQLDGVP
ncbi:MAG: hypothetical protein AB2556_19555, partial [Candidatus Thiodiazotropha sp.]